MIRPEDRGCITVRIAVKVCELLDGLYPRPTRPDGSVPKRRTAQHWPKIKAALRVTRDFTVPDATGGRWFPMALRRLPAEHPNGTPALDDLGVCRIGLGFAVKCGQHTSPLARFTRNFREYRVLVSTIGCDFPAYGLLAA